MSCGDEDEGWREGTPFITLANGDLMMAVNTHDKEADLDEETDEANPGTAVTAHVDLHRFDPNGDLISTITFAPAPDALDYNVNMGLVALGDGFALLHSTGTETPAEEPAEGAQLLLGDRGPETLSAPVHALLKPAIFSHLGLDTDGAEPRPPPSQRHLI